MDKFATKIRDEKAIQEMKEAASLKQQKPVAKTVDLQEKAKKSEPKSEKKE